VASEKEEGPGFGHIFRTANGSPYEGKVRRGEIKTLKDVREEAGGLKELMGEHWRSLKVKSSDRGGPPYGLAINAPDKFDEDLDYTVEKVDEKVYASPDSQLHNQLMQQKQNAEQRVKETKRNLSELLKQKHMLEHDIRKLRSRVEDIEEGNETRIKADFIELVDGAGASGQGGGDRAALKFLRDQNIYPSIVADFNEMDSLDDLKSEEDGGTGKLSHLPANVKAILRKKYAMYEKWKDMYGSEIQRKLNELKGELAGIERAIEETEEYLEPYVRDMEMLNSRSQEELIEDLRRHIQLRGYSSMFTEREYIIYRGLKNTGEDILVTDEEEEITHYRVVFLHMIHANLAGGEEPTQSTGPSVVKVFWHPAIVDKFVFENIFQKRIDEMDEEFQKKIREYTGNIQTDKGEELADARKEKGMSVADLRERMEEELGEQLPLEVSSRIRRVEDGLDAPNEVFHGDQIKAIDNILGTAIHEESEEEGEVFHTGIEKKLKLFTGQVDDYYLGGLEDEAWNDLFIEMTFRYYYDLKLGLGLFTMK
jgi:hypothetical protein